MKSALSTIFFYNKLRRNVTLNLLLSCQSILPNPVEMEVLEELTSELFETLSTENHINVTSPEPHTGQPTFFFDFYLILRLVYKYYFSARVHYMWQSCAEIEYYSIVYTLIASLCSKCCICKLPLWAGLIRDA